ncbi:aminodeoxychorismate/anthranilate synthase component II [Teredinibacter waterburyi]|jgi:anthranilate synthase, component II (EC 4.1.3.27)|uniref:aminodeoxychorismate/anthranilate synthase component II n=1 Tax=Teredinibacter waterburyi TaxID=1500538 RepID=UPI00165F9057|nr:aminodeoxychorismate/anthranilate synthase component II [Teredinibacter waterburyi]
MNKPALFLLDNFDSFSYNLVDEFRKFGFNLTVFRNNIAASIIVEQMEKAEQQGNCDTPPTLILSPGPGCPADAGCMPELLKQVQGRYPVLGICLGHQAIIEHYGGVICRAPEVLHGKASLIQHCGEGVFADIEQPFPVARYHSLMASQLPESLQLLAWYNDIPMAVYQPEHRMLGFQFHPESILTTQGSRLLKQSITFLSTAAELC